MIVYPLENYNTFIDVADATAKLAELGVGVEWAAVADQEQLLALSCQIIKSVAYIEDGTCVYSEAQVMMIHADLVNNGKYINLTDTTHAYTKAKVGSLQVEYNLTNDGSVTLPSVVKSLLHGCLKDSAMATGFTLA